MYGYSEQERYHGCIKKGEESQCCPNNSESFSRRPRYFFSLLLKRNIISVPKIIPSPQKKG
jgi:hypothetical protein